MFPQFNSVISVTESCLTLWPHGLQHTRLLCPSSSPGICSISYLLSWWYHPTTSSSVTLNLLLPSIFPSIRVFSSELALHIRGVWMWELDCEESSVPKNGCFWTVVLVNMFESPSDSKEIKPVNPKGNKLWIFIGRTDAETKTPILWPLEVKSQLTGKDPDPGKDWCWSSRTILRPPDVKSQLIGKDPDAGKAWGQEEKRATEDEMVRYHHWLSEYESEQTPGDSEWRKA